MLFFFFLIFRRPPSSTLFPYTTSSDLRAGRDLPLAPRRPRQPLADRGARRRDGVLAGPLRSEEHTSELQSHSDLVCRLLLEKKNNKSKIQKCRICAISETVL